MKLHQHINFKINLYNIFISSHFHRRFYESDYLQIKCVEKETRVFSISTILLKEKRKTRKSIVILQQQRIPKLTRPNLNRGF